MWFLSCSELCVGTVLKPSLLAFPPFELQAPKITSLLFQDALGPHTSVLNWDTEKRFTQLDLYCSKSEGMTCCQTKYFHYFWSSY